MAQVAHHLEEKERTRDIEIDEDVTFSDLHLSEAVMSGLHKAGFRRPSPIQLRAIPLGRCGLDLVVQAKSGTGKTCVLAVVALEAVTPASPAAQALVVAPTREVAVQVSRVVATLAVDVPGLKVSVFIGGTKLAEDMAQLRQCQVVVGTPGRLAQLVSLGHLRLDCVRLLVLDEADHLLEGNLCGTVTDLARAMPHNKQVLCMSATFSEASLAQAQRLMRSPSHVRLDRESPALLGVNQLVRRLPPAATPPLRQAAKAVELLKLLSAVTFNQCLVFSGSQLRAESLRDRLKAEGWPAAYLTGAQCQTERLAALKALCSHQCRVLVATDLAARGLDSLHVNLVVNVDLPPNPPTYLHRAGRAGRYGSHGAAVTLACGPEEWYGARAIATLANVKLLSVGPQWPDNLATHRVKGRRGLGVKLEEEGKAEGRNEEGGGGRGKNSKVKEPQETDAKNSDSEEQTGKAKQGVEETDSEKTKENPKKGKRGDTLMYEDGVLVLEEVEHLPEEEARAWVKANKPNRKADHKKQEHQKNGVREGEKSKAVLKDQESLNNNHLKHEGKDEKTKINGENNKNLTEKKVRKKKHHYRKSPSHSEDDEEENDKEEKENRQNVKANSAKRKARKNKQQLEEATNHRDADDEGEEALKERENNEGRKKPNKRHTKHTEENRKTKAHSKEEKTDDTENKTTTMSFLGKLWQRPPPINMSYSQLLSDCTPHFDNPTHPDTPFKIPPWPVQVEPSKEEVLALEKHLEGVKEEVRERKEALKGVRIDAEAILSAMMQGRDGGEVLGEVMQQDLNLSPLHTAVSLPPLTDSHRDASSSSSSLSSSSSFSSSSSSSSSIASHPTSHKKPLNHLSSTKERKYNKPTSSSSTDTSPSSNEKHKSTKPKTPLKETNNTTSILHNSDKQSYETPSSSLSLPSQPTGGTGKRTPPPPPRPNALDSQTATGARPKETKGRNQQKDQEGKSKEVEDEVNLHSPKNNNEKVNEQKTHPGRKNKKKCESVKSSNTGYGEWVPADEVKKTESRQNRDQNQTDGGHREGCEEWRDGYNYDETYNHGYQDYYNHWYPNYNHQNQSHTQDYDYNQDYYEGYNQYYNNQDYQNYNQDYEGYNQYYNNQDNQNYNQGYQQGYEDYNQPYNNKYYNYTHPPTHQRHIDAYIESACKFASMMEYVTAMGRMSLHVAQDYHKRRGDYSRQQGRFNRDQQPP